MTIERLEDLEDPRLDAYARLTDHQLRNRLDPERGVVIAESSLVIDVALDEGVELLSLLVEEERLSAAEDVIARVGERAPVYVLPKGEMSRLVGYNVTRGILSAMRRPAPRSAADVLDGARNVAVLEGLVDVSNVGAIFRNAAALGVDAVLLSPTCADPLCRRALRVSMGTVLKVPWAFCEEPWPRSAMDELHAHGLTCCAMALEDGAVPIDEYARERIGGSALFFGCEGYGLLPKTIKACDRTVIIPMSRGVDSLNVAASSAVAFWELFSRKG